MRSLDQIREAIDSIKFTSIEEWVVAFLRAFEIPEITISKIRASLQKAFEPVSLYRRALFIPISNQEDVSELIPKYRESYPILFFLGAENIGIYTKSTSILGLPYSKVSEYISLFEPIRNRGRIEKDFYATLDFAPIVGELYSQLVLNDNSKMDSFNYIMNLICLTFVDQIRESNIIAKYLDWLNSSQPESLDNHLTRIISEGNFHPFLQPLNNRISHNARTCELSIKLISSKIQDIDSEVFGSLVYKIFSTSNDISLYGNQMAKTNVDKILSPLFIQPVMELAETSPTSAVSKLLTSKFFDPTNSPGCFLTEAFTKVMETLLRLSDLYDIRRLPRLDFKNFIALVDNDVAYRLSKINLFIVYLQYLKSLNQLGSANLQDLFSALPVYKGNQLSEDWNHYCPNNGNVYVIGSPKFQGNRKLTAADKSLMKPIFGDRVKLADTDYCAAWLVKGARYIAGSTSELALVLTNSICQGSQVATIWPVIFGLNCHISFAYTPFKWSNSESRNIAVTVIAIGLKGIQTDTPRLLFDGSTCYRCNSISPYLLQNSELIVYSRTTPLSDMPPMRKGNMEYASGALIIEPEDYDAVVAEDSRTLKFLKKLKGSEEFINGGQRYCLWIKDSDLVEAESIDIIRHRILLAKNNRASSSATQKSKDNPHRFRETFDTPKNSQTLLVPSVSSENREYIPMGFVYNDTIISNLAFAVYNCQTWVLAILESRMHHIWIKLVCGQLESRFRYSNVLGYNTFPLPTLTDVQRRNLNELALELIRIREEFCELTIGDLYNHLPPKLKNIHSQIDDYVDALYSDIPFLSDYQRLTALMNNYEKLIEDRND